MNEESFKLCALVLDDKPGVTAAVSRLLSRRFDVVLTANTVEEAERHLDSCEVTHLLCDYLLGEGVPTGAELIPRWRKKYPEIARAVLFTGSVLSTVPVPPEVDALIPKPLSALDVMTAFGLE